MINVHWVVAGAVIGLAGSAGYAFDTVRGRTQPNRVTWLLWGAVPLLAFAVELRAGVGLRSLMALSVGLGPLAVFAATFANRSAVWRIQPIDYACGALSVAGTAVWLLTRVGLAALCAAIAADALAGVPTLLKSWRAPESENSLAYLGALANAAITLLTVTTVTADEVAFPLYIVLIAGIELVLVAGRLGPRVRSQADASAAQRAR
ncbi:MAG: hypothetical protein M0Z95_26970 [Actinomycetota bacterium]|nr:hypothetical protein [Actinomycetota bacterium]